MFQARCLVTKTSLKAFSGTRFLACGGFSPCPWALPCAAFFGHFVMVSWHGSVGEKWWFNGDSMAILWWFDDLEGDFVVIQWGYWDIQPLFLWLVENGLPQVWFWKEFNLASFGSAGILRLKRWKVWGGKQFVGSIAATGCGTDLRIRDFPYPWNFRWGIHWPLNTREHDKLVIHGNSPKWHWRNLMLGLPNPFFLNPLVSIGIP